MGTTYINWQYEFDFNESLSHHHSIVIYYMYIYIHIYTSLDIEHSFFYFFLSLFFCGLSYQSLYTRIYRAIPPMNKRSLIYWCTLTLKSQQFLFSSCLPIQATYDIYFNSICSSTKYNVRCVGNLVCMCLINFITYIHFDSFSTPSSYSSINFFLSLDDLKTYIAYIA